MHIPDRAASRAASAASAETAAAEMHADAASKTAVLQSLGYRVLSDVNRISVVMPTALVGTALLTLRGRGVGRIELIRRVKWLRNEIIAKGGQVAELGGGDSLARVVDRAIAVLGELIGRRNDLIEPVYYPAKRFELSFYRNQVIHLFVAECIVLVAMYSTIKAGGPVSAQRIAIAPALTDDTAFLSQLLKNEFIFGSGGLGKNLHVTIAKLQQAGVLAVGQFDETESRGAPVGARKFVTLSTEERRIGRENFDFYCFLLWPFVETYWLAAVSLYTIVPERKPRAGGKSGNEREDEDEAARPQQQQPHWVDERIFLKRCQLFGKTLYGEGDLSYFEAVNKDTLANAITRLKEMGVVQIRKGPHPLSPAGIAAAAAAAAAAARTGDTIEAAAAAAGAAAEAGRPAAGARKTSLPPVLQQLTSKDANGSWIALSPAWVPSNEFPRAQRLRLLRSHRAGGGHDEEDDAGVHDTDGHGRGGGNGGGEGNGNGNGNGNGHGGRRAAAAAAAAAQAAQAAADEADSDALLDPWYRVQPSGRLWELCEQIGRFRREGKNRRDTNTVAARVLRLARSVAHWNEGARPTAAAAAAAAAEAAAAAAAAAAAGAAGGGGGGGAALAADAPRAKL
nr:hypothetical protein HK105_003260 [Polyrhizophydium stewartii]